MPSTALNRVLAPHGGYRRMFSYGYARILDRAAAVFCSRAWSYQNDALGKARGQLLGASRSVRANIAEGSERAGLSKDTELNLLAVARGSLAEMADDFEAFLFERGEPVWSERDPRRAAVDAIRIERFAAEDDERHAYSRYLIEAWTRFSPFFKEPASLCDAANAALVLIDRTAALLTGQIAAATKETVEKGGFRERMTRARIERRDGIAQPPPDAPAPICPECGRPMRLRTAKSGPNAGKPFWGCSGYPACKGRRRAEESGDGTRTTG